jgi:hypothetical protein
MRIGFGPLRGIGSSEREAELLDRVAGQWRLQWAVAGGSASRTDLATIMFVDRSDTFCELSRGSAAVADDA